MRECHPARLRALAGSTRRAGVAALAVAGFAALLATQSTAAKAQEDILTYKGADREQKLIAGATKTLPKSALKPV